MVSWFSLQITQDPFHSTQAGSSRLSTARISVSEDLKAELANCHVEGNWLADLIHAVSKYTVNDSQPAESTLGSINQT